MSDANMGAEGTAGPGPSGKPRRWLKWALVASLALNVLFVGFAVSRALHFSGKHWRGHSPIAQVARQGRKFVRELPRERRNELWEMIRSRKDEFTADRKEVDAAVEAFAKSLTRAPFDAESTEEALLRLQDQAQLLITRGRAVTMDIISELSQSEREQLADRLLKATDD